MLTRTLITVSFGCILACSAPVKESISEQEPTDIKVVPDGVVIGLQPEADTLKGSLKAYATSKIGHTAFTINYYSPATRGRMIWGGLVAYDNVWVTGAHKATNIEFDTAIDIGETTVPAGRYAFFTIPGKDSWTIILNKNWNQHLADDYDQAEDVVRMTVTPETEETNQERLRYVIEAEGDGSGEIVMYWDKLELSIPFSIAN
ncbi:MAG TPA: DUF2911 domain-containing protein [Cyclobacteriaceae bacterium]